MGVVRKPRACARIRRCTPNICDRILIIFVQERLFRTRSFAMISTASFWPCCLASFFMLATSFFLLLSLQGRLLSLHISDGLFNGPVVASHDLSFSSLPGCDFLPGRVALVGKMGEGEARGERREARG